MIIISYSSPGFMAAAENWANYRRSQEGGAFHVKVVDIADVFDEFSYGLHSGQAIKDFLEFAHTSWQSPRPAYVLILGDASYDRRNYEGYGYWDQVPAKNYVLQNEERDGDEPLADFDNDGLADIPIGRIPARNATEIMAALDKTIAFETPANQSLYRGALFAYLPLYGYPQYEQMSHQFRNQLPRGIPVLFIPRHELRADHEVFDDPLAGQQDLIDGINRGNFVVNFSCPGATGTWGGQSFFVTEDVARLTNAANPSLFTAFGDFTALFTSPSHDSLGEALVKAPNGGAVANWGAIAVTSVDDQSLIGTEFFRLLAAGNIPRMGDLVRASKQGLAGRNVGYSWEILGDPALKVR
jgi:hypothetical protein